MGEERKNNHFLARETMSFCRFFFLSRFIFTWFFSAAFIVVTVAVVVLTRIGVMVAFCGDGFNGFHGNSPWLWRWLFR